MSQEALQEIRNFLKHPKRDLVVEALTILCGLSTSRENVQALFGLSGFLGDLKSCYRSGDSRVRELVLTFLVNACSVDRISFTADGSDNEDLIAKDLAQTLVCPSSPDSLLRLLWLLLGNLKDDQLNPIAETLKECAMRDMKRFPVENALCNATLVLCFFLASLLVHTLH